MSILRRQQVLFGDGLEEIRLGKGENDENVGWSGFGAAVLRDLRFFITTIVVAALFRTEHPV